MYTAKTKKEELENLCFAVKITIDDNYGTINHQNIDEINKFVNETIEWLYSIENIDDNDDIYEQKINNLNNLSHKLYTVCQGLDLTIKNNDLQKNNIMDKFDEFDKFINGKTDCGTSIFDLAQQQAQKEIEHNITDE
jgi:hypothetical protein